MSLPLVDELALARDSVLLAAGGGTSTLVDRLPARRHSDSSGLALSETGFETRRGRLGGRAAANGIRADSLASRPPASISPGHGGVVLRLPIDSPGRARDHLLMWPALASEGIGTLGSFTADRPNRCPGLPVGRSGSGDLTTGSGAGFELLARRARSAPSPGGGR